VTVWPTAAVFQIRQYGLVTTGEESLDARMMITVDQAYEAAYRFVAQYYERERIEPFMLMLVAMEPRKDLYRTNDPASWSDWQQCVRSTLDGAPLPDL
jgi:hypothetical protein